MIQFAPRERRNSHENEVESGIREIYGEDGIRTRNGGGASMALRRRLRGGSGLELGCLASPILGRRRRGEPTE
jgi:hypothetical protein